VSFGVGRLEGLEDVGTEGMSSQRHTKLQVMKRDAVYASAWHPCVCKINVDLGCLILGHSINALITSNTSERFDLEKVHSVW